MFHETKLTLVTHSTHSILFYAFIYLVINLFYFATGSYTAWVGLKLLV